jgi:hypothetical protein
MDFPSDFHYRQYRNEKADEPEYQQMQPVFFPVLEIDDSRGNY